MVWTGRLQNKAESDSYARPSLLTVLAAVGNGRFASHPDHQLERLFQPARSGSADGHPASAACCLSFVPGGPANHAPGFYNWDKKDLGPRVALAWSPSAPDGLWKSLFGEGDKTVIRAGYGIVYDRLGPALLATFDASGSFGLSTPDQYRRRSNPEHAPSITALSGFNNIPTRTYGSQTCAGTRAAFRFHRHSPMA